MTKTLTRLSIAALAISLTAPFALAAAPKPAPKKAMPKLVLVTAEDVEDSVHGAWLRMMYADACARAGVDMALQSYPARRASAMSSSP